jgi:hypothetical protein
MVSWGLVCDGFMLTCGLLSDGFTAICGLPSDGSMRHWGLFHFFSPFSVVLLKFCLLLTLQLI